MATFYTNKSSGGDATRVFTVSGITIVPTAGATYTNNSVTFTVVGISIDGVYLHCNGSGVPEASGTLTKTAGTGDATITFSAYQAGGSSVTAAYLTIQATITAAASGDTIIVGSGNYNEKLSWAGTKNLTFSADGIVQLDGNGIGNYSQVYYIPTNSAPYYLTFNAYNNKGKWRFINGEGTYVIEAYGYQVGSAGTLPLTLTDCELISKSATTGAICYTQNNCQTQMYLTRCVFSGFSNYGSYHHYQYGSGGVNASIVNCTYYNCGTAHRFSTASVGSFLTFQSNIISNCTTAINVNLASGRVPSKTNQYYSITNYIYNGTTYATLALAQAAGYELSSIVETPNFTDTTNKLFYLTSPSSLGRNQGAIPFGWVHAKNYATVNGSDKWNIIAGAGYDNTGWYNPDGNVSKNGTTGFLELTGGTSGVIWSPVYDFGAVQNIKAINLGVNQTWGTHMADTTKTDVRPNYQTIEVRATGASYNQNDATANWTEVKTEYPISGVSGRYVQVRVTLRSDDIAS
jgi:hypothetical protein